jgi:hypothetical protein
VSDRRADAHERHDRELVARAAAGDLAASEAIAARDLLAACAACASLASDLRAIATATRGLPSASVLAATITRAPRDFRLTQMDAARLSRGGLLGLRRRFASAGGGDGAFRGRAGGLGGALATLGLVGLLVSVGVPALNGGLGASGGAASQLESAPSKDGASFVPVALPAATDAYVVRATDHSAIQGQPREAAPESTPWTIAAGVSIVVIGAGIALLLIGWRTRHGRPEGT